MHFTSDNYADNIIFFFFLSQIAGQQTSTISTGALVGGSVAVVLVIGILILYCNRRAMRKSKKVNVENVPSTRVGHVNNVPSTRLGHVVPVVSPRNNESITSTVEFYNQSDFWPINDRDRFQQSRKTNRCEPLLVETVL
jgi:hypothetical protein